MSRLIVTNIETQNIKFDSDTTAFTIGSDGVLSGTGSPAIVKLNTFTISSAVSSFTVDSTYINSTYDTYKFIYDLLPATDGTNLYNRAVVNGSVDTGNNYGFETFPLDGGSTRVSDSTNVMVVHNKYGIGNDAGAGISGEFTLFNVNSTTRSACVSGHSTGWEGTPVPTQMVFGGAYKSSERAKVLNGFNFFMDDPTSDIASGFITVYGVK